ncbi:MAG TPA: septum formation family protein [Trebonia sp.]
MSTPTADPAVNHAQAPAGAAPAGAPTLEPAGPEMPLAPPDPPREPQDVLTLPSPPAPPPDLTADDAAPPGPVPAAMAPLSWLAVAALVTGVLPVIPLGLGLGVAGLVTTRRGRRRGRDLAVIGLLATIVWIAVGGTLGAVAELTHGFHKPVKIKYNYVQSAVFDLRQGDCLNNVPSVSSPSLTSCNSPHDAEVFATFALSGASWPGAAVLQQEAQAGCSAQLSSYLNPQLAISLTQDYVYPGQVAWQAGTRTVVCEVRATTGQLHQSVGSASATHAS